MSIALIDTSVFCNIVPVPGRAQDESSVKERLRKLIAGKTVLLLPIATVLETGNHIAQMRGGGQLRRRVAAQFSKLVADALDGMAPWTPTQTWELTVLRGWLDEFPGHAIQGRGFADLTIVKEWERQCTLHRGRRVFIWSLDGEHLGSYDRVP